MQSATCMAVEDVTCAALQVLFDEDLSPNCEPKLRTHCRAAWATRPNSTALWHSALRVARLSVSAA